jgi:hypothetical protein
MFFPKKSPNFFFSASLVFLVCYLLNFNNYTGSKFLFFIFNLSSFGLFLFAVKKNNSAFEFFTFFFFLLSFWLKFNCILYFESIQITEGNFDLGITNYDNGIFIVIIVFAACMCASLIKEFIIKQFNKEVKFKINSSFIAFYKNCRIYFLFLLLGFLILVWFTNFYYKIYSKGLVNDHINPFITYFYSWSLTYGLAVLTSLFIYIDFLIFNKSKIFILGIFESFFSNMSIYSRSFLLSFIAYLRGFLLLINIKKFKFLKLDVVKFIFMVLIIFLLSIYFANKLRSSHFYETHKPTNQISLASTFTEIYSLSVNRWVGIDALLAVSQSKNLSFNLFLSSWQEKKNLRKKSFYINNFFSRFEYSNFEKENLNIVITPGIVAFLYYSGSALFVFFSILILILACSSIEMLFFHFSLGNIILANIIGYALSVRFIHFGYIPSNIINFLLSIFVTFFIIYFFTQIIKKNNFKG